MTQLLSQERFTEFGIPPEAFKSGKPVETTIIVYDLKQLKDLLDHGFDDGGRQAHIEALFDGIVHGDVTRYELPHLGALNFVMTRALGGGVTRSLALDAHGKSLSSLLLDLDI